MKSLKIMTISAALALTIPAALAQDAAMDHGEMDHSQMDHSQMDHSQMEMEKGEMVHSDMGHSDMNHENMDHATMDHSDTNHENMDHATMDHGEMSHDDHDHSDMNHAEMDHSEMDHSEMDKADMMDSGPAEGATVIVAEVNGLVCDFCAQALKKVFKKEEAVDSIHVDLDAGEVRVTLLDGQELADERVAKLIRKSGYSLVSTSRQTAE